MEQSAKKDRDSKHAYWRHHIDSWQESGQSQQRYCRNQGIALSTFGYWRRKLTTRNVEKPRFYPLVISTDTPVTETSRAQSSGLRLFLGDNRFTIEIDERFSPSTLSEVVTTLDQL